MKFEFLLFIRFYLFTWMG